MTLQSHLGYLKSIRERACLEAPLITGATAEQYFKLLDATQNSQAVEGSTAGDDFSAACMIREYANKQDEKLVAAENPTSIKRALGVVLNRYNLGGKQRANTIGGTVVAAADNGE